MFKSDSRQLLSTVREYNSGVMMLLESKTQGNTKADYMEGYTNEKGWS